MNEEWMNERIKARIDGWKNRRDDWINKWMDGWINEHFFVQFFMVDITLTLKDDSRSGIIIWGLVNSPVLSSLATDRSVIESLDHSLLAVRNGCEELETNRKIKSPWRYMEYNTLRLRNNIWNYPGFLTVFRTRCIKGWLFITSSAGNCTLSPLLGSPCNVFFLLVGYHVAEKTSGVETQSLLQRKPKTKVGKKSNSCRRRLYHFNL